MKLPELDLCMRKKTCQPMLLKRAWLALRRALSLHYSPPRHFGSSQWQTGLRPPLAYLIYRWLLFLTLVSIAVTSFANQRLPPQYKGPEHRLNYFKWFIYFTNWGFMLIALQAGLAAVVVHLYRNQRTFNLPYEEEEAVIGSRSRSPLVCRAYWLAQNVATDLAFVITLIYWTLVHDPKIHENDAINLLVHGGNSIIMLVEIAVTAHPIRMAHAMYGAAVGVAYGLFSALYWAAGGTDRLGMPAIYPTLDWNKPGLAFGFVSVCAVVLVCAHGLATLAALARARLAARLRPAAPASPAPRDHLPLPTH